MNHSIVVITQFWPIPTFMLLPIIQNSCILIYIYIYTYSVYIFIPNSWVFCIFQWTDTFLVQKATLPEHRWFPLAAALILWNFGTNDFLQVSAPIPSSRSVPSWTLTPNQAPPGFCVAKWYGTRDWGDSQWRFLAGVCFFRRGDCRWLQVSAWLVLWWRLVFGCGWIS